MPDEGHADARNAQRLARRAARTLLLLLLAPLLLLGANAPAHAHTGLIGSTPAAGDTVALDSDRLVLTFSDELATGSNQVAVLDEQALDAVSGDPVVVGASMEVPLALRSQGRHEVTYRVVAGDGHAIVGEFEFTVGSAGSADSRDAVSRAAAGTPASDSAWVSPAVARVAWGGGVVLVLVGLVLLRRVKVSPRTLEHARHNDRCARARQQR